MQMVKISDEQLVLLTLTIFNKVTNVTRKRQGNERVRVNRAHRIMLQWEGESTGGGEGKKRTFNQAMRKKKVFFWYQITNEI